MAKASIENFPAKKSPRPRAPTGKIVWVTAGQWELGRVAGRLGVIATALGVSRMSVSDWRRGNVIPEVEHRTSLARRYGIPVTTWLKRAPVNELERFEAWGFRVAEPLASSLAATRAGHTELSNLADLLRRAPLEELAPRLEAAPAKPKRTTQEILHFWRTRFEPKP